MSPLSSHKTVLDSAFVTLKKEARKALLDKKILSQRDEAWLYVDPKVFIDALNYQDYPQLPPHFSVKEDTVQIHNGHLLNSPAELDSDKISITQTEGEMLETVDISGFTALECAQIEGAQRIILFDFKKSLDDCVSITLTANQVASALCQIKVAKDQSITLNVETCSEALLMTSLLVHCEENAKLTINVLSKNGNQKPEHFLSRVFLKDGANFYQNHLVCNQNLYRLDTQVKSLGQNTYTHLKGVALLESDQVASFNTLVHLTQIDCESHQEYRTVLKDKSQSDYNGLVYVEPEAQQTNSDQMNRNMILEMGPRTYSRPQLQIFADDVRCTHGATTGQIDPEELLYIQSRGIDEQKAKELLVQAYVSFILDALEDQKIKESWQHCLRSKIEYFLDA